MSRLRAGCKIEAIQSGESPERRPSKGVRPCRRDDLPEVAALYEQVMRSGRRAAAPRLADYFHRTLFDCPSADPEIPSLVYEDASGRIAAFVASHVRRARFDGRVIRVACGGQLIADPAARGRAVGAILFRARLQGAQDATFTDGASSVARGMYAACGGEAALLKTIAWTRVLRPVRFAADYALGRLRRPQLARRLRPLWRPLDAAAARAARRFLPPAPATRAEPLTARAVLEHMPAVTQSLRLHPDYDEAYLEWLFREMAAVTSRGKLVRSLVRDSGGRFIGWYVYYLKDGVSQVEQVAAVRDASGDVLDHLLHHARANGSAAVRGRLEPQLFEALSRRRCLFSWHGDAAVHSRDAALKGVLLSSKCWLGRMDGDSWMGHHTEAFE